MSQSTADADRDRLHELGYAQELNRRMGTFSNFAISFSIISVLAGALTSFSLGMLAGGPRIIFLGWIVVGVGALAVGAAMGEICSAYPTAGGLYYWSAKLARKDGAKWAWFTGWFNLVGQIGVIASVDWALANYVLYSFRLLGWDSLRSTKWTVYLTYLILLAIHGLLNTYGVNLVKLLGDISVWWHVFGSAIIVIALLLAKHGGGPGVFEWKNGTGWSFPGSGLYVGFIGLLLAQYTITGFDASAHVSEETHGAATSAPKAIVRSIYISAIAALAINWAMVLAIPKGQYDKIAGGGILAGALVVHRCLDGIRREAPRHHRHGRSVLLRHGLGHRQQPDDLRLQPGQRASAQPGLAQDQPEDPDTDELPVAGRRTVRSGRIADADPDAGGHPGRLLRTHPDVRDRALHQLHHPHLPAAAEPRVQAGAMEPWRPLEVRRLVRRRLRAWHLHHRAAAAVRAVEQVGDRQPHAAGRRWHRPRRGAVVDVGSAKKWFKGPKVQGSARGVARHRATSSRSLGLSRHRRRGRTVAPHPLSGTPSRLVRRRSC